MPFLVVYLMFWVGQIFILLLFQFCAAVFLTIIYSMYNCKMSMWHPLFSMVWFMKKVYSLYSCMSFYIVFSAFAKPQPTNCTLQVLEIMKLRNYMYYHKIGSLSISKSVGAHNIGKSIQKYLLLSLHQVIFWLL